MWKYSYDVAYLDYPSTHPMTLAWRSISMSFGIAHFSRKRIYCWYHLCRGYTISRVYWILNYKVRWCTLKSLQLSIIGMRIHVKREYTFDTLSLEYASFLALFTTDELTPMGPHVSTSTLLSCQHKMTHKPSLFDGNYSDSHLFKYSPPLWFWYTDLNNLSPQITLIT